MQLSKKSCRHIQDKTFIHNLNFRTMHKTITNAWFLSFA